MSDQLTAEDIEAAFAQEVTTKRCRLGIILHEHPSLTDRVMDVTKYDAAMIQRVLKRLELPVSKDTIIKHRKGDCLCTGRNQR